MPDDPELNMAWGDVYLYGKKDVKLAGDIRRPGYAGAGTIATCAQPRRPDARAL